jgi:hypothetical protein
MENEYYGIGEKPHFEGSMSGYRIAFNYELNGNNYHLVMDKGDEYFLKLCSPNIIEWSKNNDLFRWTTYECLKAEETTYMINFLSKGEKPTTCLTFILDIGQRLCMVVEAHTDVGPEPLMVMNDIYMGAIDVSGFPLPRHRFEDTEDLVGKRATWTYGPDMHITHVYYHKNYIRVDVPQEFRKGWPMNENQRRSFEMIDDENRGYDEWARYIKIKEWIYVVNVLEQSTAHQGLIGNNLLFLMDLQRMRDVGRSFGHTQEHTVENYMYSAVGKFVASDGKLEARINPRRLDGEIKYKP